MINGTVVITGADRPLGRAVARGLDGDVDTLLLAGADGDALASSVEVPEGSESTVERLRTDVRDEYDVERLLETGARLGHLGMVIPCDRVDHRASNEFLEVGSYAAFDDLLRLNVRGTYVTLRETLGQGTAETAIVVPILDVDEPSDLFGVGELAIGAMARALGEDQPVPTRAVPLDSMPLDPDADAEGPADRVVTAARDVVANGSA